MTKLAILGGQPVIKKPFLPFNTIGKDEKKAVQDVLDTGILSGFVGAPSEEFNGGKYVRELENNWCEKFNTRYAVSVNSATSGLYAAMGAIGISSGDEVIVPPYTMSATAMAPVVYGAVPIFADIEEETFCLDPECVKNAITSKTKAIIAVNLFGHPAALHDLKIIAETNNIKLIEDNSQAPLAIEKNKYCGTIGHIGIFSLNRHKHIQSGEGGICVTDDSNLAERLQLIRNHGENLVEHLDLNNAKNLIGFNYRLTELSAAIAICQLNKAENIIEKVIKQCEELTSALSGIDGITVPKVRNQCKHVYYAWPVKFNSEKVGVNRKLFAEALCAEGVPVNQGYVKPLYHLPIFENKNTNDLCPVAERMYFKEELGFGICSYNLSHQNINMIVDAWNKVYENKEKLLILNKER